MRSCRVSGVHARQKLLPGEIDGLETSYYHVGSRGVVALEEHDGSARIVFVVAGTGTILIGGRSHQVNGMGALYCDAGRGMTVSTLESDIDLLEIVVSARFPAAEKDRERFISYAQCPRYQEATKSARTVSRTIVPESVIPRFCMGSVETRGPDEVGAHSHPMLEQLFFGLPGNECTVSADNEEAPFGDAVLLHIPRGSMHGVAVAAGKQLHYLWMDFFQSDDMSYIRGTHLPVGEEEGG